MIGDRKDRCIVFGRNVLRVFDPAMGQPVQSSIALAVTGGGTGAAASSGGAGMVRSPPPPAPSAPVRPCLAVYARELFNETIVSMVRI